ncbi:glycosyltransferase family 4 protein [Aerococcus sp. L_32]|uniref:glycosyltransferase family 4 protein n=1 Tax=Aerococcus sp. L_32 TaxID=3422316 RepID=UPI003D6C5B67
MKKKILFLVNHEIVIYNFRKEIVERFIKEGFEVIISSPSGDKIDELVKMGCIHEEIQMDRHGVNILENYKLYNSYVSLFKKIKPDIILGFTIKPNIFGSLAARKLKIPFVANITGLGSAVENPGIMQKITVLLYKSAFTNIQTVFFQNEANRQFFVDKNIAIQKHKMLPGSGVNLKQFIPLDYPPKDTIEFVFISRIMKEKGIDQYLEAAEFITKKYSNTKFHICGFCEEKYEEILEKEQKKGNIVYHGMIKDVRQILKQTHCTVHPTYYPEGLSNVLLESAASERPIITTNRSGTKEVVDDGVNGYLIKHKNTKDLIEKIEKFIQLSYEEKINMGKFGRNKVKNQFDREIVIEAYLKEVQLAF